MHLECAQRVLVVRRDEHDDRRAIEQLQHFESVELRHLNVEEKDVGIVLRDRADRFEAIRGFGDDLEVLVRTEVFAKDVAGERLVVNDDGSNHAGRSISTRYFPLASSVRSDARPFEIAASRPRAF